MAGRRQGNRANLRRVTFRALRVKAGGTVPSPGSLREPTSPAARVR